MNRKEGASGNGGDEARSNEPAAETASVHDRSFLSHGRKHTQWLGLAKRRLSVKWAVDIRQIGSQRYVPYCLLPKTHFFRNWSSDTIFSGARSALPSSASDAALLALIVVGAGAASSRASRCSAGISSNCSPNCTEGSKNPFTASKTIDSFSGTLSKESSTSKCRSCTARFQNWCCSTMVISFGYLRLSRSDSFTPSCRLLMAMKKWWSPGSPVRAALSRASRTTRLSASWTRRSYRIRSSAMAPAAESVPEFSLYPENQVQASVARCLRTPPEAAKPQGFDFRSLEPHYAALATGA